jgi:hypothetical protein
MNRHERITPSGTEALLQYGTPENKVLRHGTFVTCGVTGIPILLDDLKYWSVALQEPYASAEAMWLRLGPNGRAKRQ